MSVSRTSRYQTWQQALFTDRNGNPQLALVHHAPAAARLTVRDYLWRVHDRVDSVAAKFYLAEDSWWLFAQANPNTLDWTQPTPGTAVIIPHGVA
jgi:hypothetical protein